MVERGAITRLRLYSLVEEVEAAIGRHAISVVGKEEILMIQPRLIEFIRNQPDASILEPSLTICFSTKYTRRKVREDWKSIINSYKKKKNTENLLLEKSIYLAVFIVSNFDYSLSFELNNSSVELSDNQREKGEIEEACLWYRIIDELAFRFLGKDRDIFMEYFEDNFGFDLALSGIPPELINHTLAVRSKEYVQFQEWAPDDGSSTKGNLLLEAGKNISNALGLRDKEKILFPAAFSLNFLKRLEAASLEEFLKGE